MRSLIADELLRRFGIDNPETHAGKHRLYLTAAAHVEERFKRHFVSLHPSNQQ